MTASLTLTRIGLRRRNDDEVFSLALGGDPVAFSEVYRRYSKRIYGYCLARLMEPEAAADAAQEVFVRFLDAPRKGIEQPRAWLFGVARHVTIDAIRKRSRTPDPTDDEAMERAVGASATDTADEALGRDDARNVFVALRRLRPRYREALILRELHHETSADMADALETTPGAVDTLVSRARDAFGRAYAEVSGLPEGCGDAVAAIYKRKGTGIDAVEEARLESHLTACPHCQKEAKRALRLDGLAALLPFLVPVKKIGLNLFEHAALTLKSHPDLAAQLGYSAPADRLAPALKVAAGLLALSLVAVPVAGNIASRNGGSSVSVAHAATPASRGSVTTSVRGQWSCDAYVSPAQQFLDRCRMSGSSQQSGMWTSATGSWSANTCSSGGSYVGASSGSTTSRSSGTCSDTSSSSTTRSSSTSYSKPTTRRVSSGSTSTHSSGSSSSSGCDTGSSSSGSGSWSESHSGSGGSTPGW